MKLPKVHKNHNKIHYRYCVAIIIRNNRSKFCSVNFLFAIKYFSLVLLLRSVVNIYSMNIRTCRIKIPRTCSYNLLCVASYLITMA